MFTIVNCFHGTPIELCGAPQHGGTSGTLVITDFTHTVSEVPCVVEQRALVLFYEGRSAVTTVANFWELSLKVNISYSWIDLRF